MLLLLLLPASLMAAAAATAEQSAAGKQDLSAVCGKAPHKRIVGGVVSADGAWPWAAAITIHDPHADPRFCGGVLVSSEWVLTTAHCINKIGSSGADFFEIVLGTNDLSDMAAEGRVDMISEIAFPHPEWTDTYWTENDVGLIKLPEPVEFNQHIAPTCLPSRGEDFTGKTATAIGWGKLAETDATHSDLLHEVELQIISNTLCQVDYGPWVNECHMCVDTYYGQKGICAGDAGSPLMFNSGSCWKSIGIADWINKGMCKDGKPHGFQRVEHYLDWISDMTGVLVH